MSHDIVRVDELRRLIHEWGERGLCGSHSVEESRIWGQACSELNILLPRPLPEMEACVCGGTPYKMKDYAVIHCSNTHTNELDRCDAETPQCANEREAIEVWNTMQKMVKP